MNKRDLVNQVAASTGLTQKEASKVVDAIFDSITGALASGGEIRIRGFGTFSVGYKKAYRGRNPRTGETIQIPRSKRPKLKPSSVLTDAVKKPTDYPGSR